MGEHLEKTSIQWHPGFYGAAELELISNKDVLAFQREYNLGKEPLRMDLLIIKKLTDIRVENEIGHIFKKYNVVEYKSPEDGLSIDDYFKTIGYACLYKGAGSTVNQIPEEELTISIFRDTYPRELFEALVKSGRTIEERYPGIYYVFGNVLFDTQIIVTSRLKGTDHCSLRILSRNPEKEDIKAFIEGTRWLQDPGDKDNVDAVLQVSIAANESLYREVRRDFSMCEALKELMKDVIDAEVAERVAAKVAEASVKARTDGWAEGIEEGRVQGIEQGIEQGRAQGKAEGMEEGSENAMLSAIMNLMDTTKWTAEQAMDAIKVPQADRSRYAAML